MIQEVNSLIKLCSAV